MKQIEGETHKAMYHKNYIRRFTFKNGCSFIHTVRKQELRMTIKDSYKYAFLCEHKGIFDKK